MEEILLRQLKSITAYARSHETEFVELVTKQNEKELNRLMRNSNKELVQAKERIKKLDSIMQRLYEDNISGKLSDERFQKDIENRERVRDNGSPTVDAGLAEIIRSFVEKIEVKKPEKIPGTRTKKQTLVIWWNFIGVVDISQQEQKEKA